MSLQFHAILHSFFFRVFLAFELYYYHILNFSQFSRTYRLEPYFSKLSPWFAKETRTYNAQMLKSKWQHIFQSFPRPQHWHYLFTRTSVFSGVFNEDLDLYIYSTVPKCVLFFCFQKKIYLHPVCLLSTPHSRHSLDTPNRNFPHMIKCNPTMPSQGSPKTHAFQTTCFVISI